MLPRERELGGRELGTRVFLTQLAEPFLGELLPILERRALGETLLFHGPVFRFSRRPRLR
jgi:hypothetical protein